MRTFKLPLLLAALALFCLNANAAERLRMATTTSTENSGLLAYLHPVFERENDIELDVIAVGTGKALRLAENGDVDLILVHAPAAERKFVGAGFGVKRHPVMHNDFLIVGPKHDPAYVRGAQSATAALAAIASTQSAFVSRGDDSGTHKKELALWKQAQLQPKGEWYLAVGQGMGATLQVASEKQAYSLTDRGTWLAMRDKLQLSALGEGDSALFNPYHVIAVNPERHSHVKTELAQRYIEFITGPEAQRLIGEYTVNGEVLFHPDAN